MLRTIALWVSQLIVIPVDMISCLFISAALARPKTDIEKKAAAEKAKCFCVPICVDLSYNVEISSGPFEKADQLNTGKTLAQLEGWVSDLWVELSYLFKSLFKVRMHGVH